MGERGKYKDRLKQYRKNNPEYTPTLADIWPTK
jgi:hypothetical protein